MYLVKCKAFCNAFNCSPVFELTNDLGQLITFFAKNNCVRNGGTFPIETIKVWLRESFGVIFFELNQLEFFEDIY